VGSAYRGIQPGEHPGRVATLLAIEPVPASDDSDTATIVADLRAERE
jgi:hypothetical protein